MAVQHASNSSLHSEQGSILLVGLAMLLPLVALLWFVVGIGDAIAHRERLQDGADAVAFAGAVTHARGMNLIVTINILMAGILSVLVAVKVLQLINSIAMAISCALAIFGFTAPICTATTSLQAPIASTIPPVQSAIDTVLPVLSKMQVGVARATPALALAYSIAASKDNETLGAESPFAMMASVPLALPHIGLPVEEDTFQTLCGKAGSTIGNLVFRPFGTFGTWIGGAVGAITQTFPLYFCGDAGNFDLQKGITDRFEAAAQKVCEEEQASLTGEALAKSKETCLKTKSGDMKSQFEKTGKIPDSAGLAAAAKTPKKMYHRAFNGNGYFQVWGVVRYRDPRLDRDLRGIRVAGGEIPAEEVSEPSAGFSQAEYFYDAPDPWAVAQGASMWNPKWRARLVRVRPIEAATSMLEGWVAWKLTDYVNTYVFKPMGSHGQASALLMNSPEAGKYVKGPINDLVRKGTNEGFDAAERILGNPSLGIIH